MALIYLNLLASKYLKENLEGVPVLLILHGSESAGDTTFIVVTEAFLEESYSSCQQPQLQTLETQSVGLLIRACSVGLHGAPALA